MGLQEITQDGWIHIAMHRRCNPAQKENAYMKINRVAVILAGVAALLFLVAGRTALAAPAQTGQGIMVNITTAGNFAFTETQTYSFNVTTASGYYTNVWDGNAPT